MLELKGSHGTTESRAEIIGKEQAFKKESGRRGEGAYFWKRSRHYKKLAVAWHHRSLDNGKYWNDKKKECAVITCEFLIKESEFIDLETDEIRDNIAEIIEKHAISNSFKKISGVFDMYLKRLEKEEKTFYKIIQARLSSPGKKYCEKFYPHLALGDPTCYIMRTNDCIRKITIDLTGGHA